MRHLRHSITYSRLLHHRVNNFSRSVSHYIYGNNNENQSKKQNHNSLGHKVLIGTSLTALLVYKLYDYRKHAVSAQKKSDSSQTQSFGLADKKLPYYTLQEVSEHSTKETRIWVTYKEGIYDVTDYINKHPGGEYILLAAGSSVEPFWLLYAAHKNPEVLKILESMRIGNISKQDTQHLIADMTDPFSTDPPRHKALKPASEKPFCGEVPLFLLDQQFITPNELFYVRNHLPVPNIDPETYELEVEVEGTNKTIVLTLDELKKLPKHSVTSTVMCAGNRRSEMIQIKPVKGLVWGAGAIGNATWTGVRLRDVLQKVGVDEDDKKLKHVQFEGLDYDPTGKPYGASIPLWKAMNKRGDVILAYEMNGVPIPKDHGFPVRVVVPGVAGARSVKWLGRIVVSEQESESHWQQNDYKGFSPSTDWDTADFTKSPAIQELPVISAICKPSEGESVTVKDGHILVKGYAWSGGGQKILRVDVTADGGDTWHVADLDCQDSAEPPQHWSWTLWSVRVPIKSGTKNVEIWAKAVDSCYNTQPETFKNIWNFRGVLSNAYHRVTVNLK